MYDGKQTLLVTGGCGFIGSHFVRLILRERPTWRVINVDKLTYAGNLDNLVDVAPQHEASAYRFVRADIADPQEINALFQSEAIKAVVNFAAESHVDRSLLDSSPFMRTNVEGTRILWTRRCVTGFIGFFRYPRTKFMARLARRNHPSPKRALCSPIALMLRVRHLQTCWLVPTTVASVFRFLSHAAATTTGLINFRRSFCRYLLPTLSMISPCPCMGTASTSATGFMSKTTLKLCLEF